MWLNGWTCPFTSGCWGYLTRQTQYLHSGELAPKATLIHRYFILLLPIFPFDDHHYIKGTAAAEITTYLKSQYGTSVPFSWYLVSAKKVRNHPPHRHWSSCLKTQEPGLNYLQYVNGACNTDGVTTYYVEKLAAIKAATGVRALLITRQKLTSILSGDKKDNDFSILERRSISRGCSRSGHVHAMHQDWHRRYSSKQT